jgi:uncharacterized protein
MSKPTCDMKRDCPNPVTHIGEKGFIYCAEHAPGRKRWEHCRQMRPWELKLIDSGTPLPSYEPITLHEYRRRLTAKAEFRDKNPQIHYCADPGSPKMNQQQALADPVLTRFRDAARARYGDRLVRIVFFGSRARGDHRPDSDYDIAVFLNDYDSLWTELDPLVDITTDILSDTGAVISAKPFRADSYKAQTLFMGELRREGIDL